MTQLTVVVGGQYGSEGKGAVCGFLGRRMGPADLAIRVAGPNAGHTAYDHTGRAWALRSLPVAAVTSPDCRLHIAAGSEIDLDVLWSEVEATEEAGFNTRARLTVHPSATYLDDRYKGDEAAAGLVGRVGSTGKGIGAARAARIMRTAVPFGDMKEWRPGFRLSAPGPLDLAGVPWAVVEGTQGYGLGLHTRNYPRTTSSDCRAVDFLSMAGISPWAREIGPLEVIVVARVYPIRVAGNSGPMQGETSWETLGLPEERTTVTQKIRRVGSWDHGLLDEAIRANGGGGWSGVVKLAITMLDQKYPNLRDLEWDNIVPTASRVAAYNWLESVQEAMECDIAYVGTGPNTMSEVII